jgi:catechol 2,3-dioxygenase-like lactoylglutathione lyase family enzyme
MPEFGDSAGFQTRGINHLALVCSDMERTVEFYRDVLGFPLSMTIELPGNGGQHFFFDIGNDTQLAFFWFPGAPAREPGISAPAALPGLGDITTAVSSMNHVAFDVAPEKIDEYAAKLRSAGIEMLGPVNHDHSEQGWSIEMHDGVFLRSVYFFDPDGVALEFAAWMRAIRPDDVRHQPISAATV